MPITQDTRPVRTDVSPFRTVTAQEGVIREYCMRAAQAAQSSFRELEQRSYQRVPYPRLIPLTPVQTLAMVPDDGPLHVVGKHLSPLGLDFFHHDPIPQRDVIVSLEIAPDQWIHFLMKITWCRFLRANWYDSGGRFIKVVQWCGDGFAEFMRRPRS